MSSVKDRADEIWDRVQNGEPVWLRTRSISGDGSDSVQTLSQALTATQQALRALRLSQRVTSALAQAEARVSSARRTAPAQRVLGLGVALSLRQLLEGLLGSSAYFISHTNVQRQIARYGVGPATEPEGPSQFRHAGDFVDMGEVLVTGEWVRLLESGGGQPEGAIVGLQFALANGIAAEEVRPFFREGARAPVTTLWDAQQIQPELSWRRILGRQYQTEGDIYRARSDQEVEFLFRSTPPRQDYNAFESWVDDILEAFDDPGDPQRPQYGPGQSIGGVLLVAEAPTLEGLQEKMSLLLEVFTRWESVPFSVFGGRRSPLSDSWAIVETSGTSPYREEEWVRRTEAEAAEARYTGFSYRQATAWDLIRAPFMVSPGGSVLVEPLQPDLISREYASEPTFRRLAVWDLFPALGDVIARAEVVSAIYGQGSPHQKSLETLASLLVDLVEMLEQKVQDALESLQSFLAAGEAVGVHKLWIPLQSGGVQGLKNFIVDADPTRQDLQRVTWPGDSDFNVGDFLPYEEALELKRALGGRFDFRPVENMFVGGVGVFFSDGPLARWIEGQLGPKKDDAYTNDGGVPAETFEVYEVSEEDGQLRTYPDRPVGSGTRTAPRTGAPEVGADRRAPTGSRFLTDPVGFRRWGPAVSYQPEDALLRVDGDDILADAAARVEPDASAVDALPAVGPRTRRLYASGGTPLPTSTVRESVPVDQERRALPSEWELPAGSAIQGEEVTLVLSAGGGSFTSAEVDTWVSAESLSSFTVSLEVRWPGGRKGHVAFSVDVPVGPTPRTYVLPARVPMFPVDPREAPERDAVVTVVSPPARARLMGQSLPLAAQVLYARRGGWDGEDVLPHAVTLLAERHGFLVDAESVLFSEENLRTGSVLAAGGQPDPPLPESRATLVVDGRSPAPADVDSSGTEAVFGSPEDEQELADLFAESGSRRLTAVTDAVTEGVPDGPGTNWVPLQRGWFHSQATGPEETWVGGGRVSSAYLPLPSSSDSRILGALVWVDGGIRAFPADQVEMQGASARLVEALRTEFDGEPWALRYSTLSLTWFRLQVGVPRAAGAGYTWGPQGERLSLSSSEALVVTAGTPVAGRSGGYPLYGVSSPETLAVTAPVLVKTTADDIRRQARRVRTVFRPLEDARLWPTGEWLLWETLNWRLSFAKDRGLTWWTRRSGGWEIVHTVFSAPTRQEQWDLRTDYHPVGGILRVRVGTSESEQEVTEPPAGIDGFEMGYGTVRLGKRPSLDPLLAGGRDLLRWEEEETLSGTIQWNLGLPPCHVFRVSAARLPTSPE